MHLLFLIIFSHQFLISCYLDLIYSFPREDAAYIQCNVAQSFGTGQQVTWSPLKQLQEMLLHILRL